jgi:hypothetical protein
MSVFRERRQLFAAQTVVAKQEYWERTAYMASTWLYMYFA